MRDRPGAMPAHVVERADHVIGAAHRDHRQPAAVDHDVVAGVAQPARVAEQVPGAVEHRAAFERHRFGIAVPARRERAGCAGLLRRKIRGGFRAHEARYWTRVLLPTSTTATCAVVLPLASVLITS